jgi:hypothetical protein
MERNSLTQYWFFSGINDDFDKYFVHMQFVSLYLSRVQFIIIQYAQRFLVRNHLGLCFFGVKWRLLVEETEVHGKNYRPVASH